MPLYLNMPDGETDRIRPQFRLGVRIATPWAGVDSSPVHLKVLARLPGVDGIVDPATLRTLPGGGQVMRCAISRKPFIDPDLVRTSALVNKGSGKMISFASGATFKPDVGNAIIMNQERWSVIFAMSPDNSYTGLGYLFSKIIADASEGRPDFSIGMNNVKICEFEHNPGVSSQIISPHVWGADEYGVVAISQSPEYGMTISINGEFSHNVPGATAGLSSVAVERMFQIGNYGIGGPNGFRGKLGWSMFLREDYNNPLYASMLADAVAVMRDYYAF